MNIFMKLYTSPQKTYILLIIIVILGALFRFGLIQRNPLWLDEAMMFNFANHADFSEVMEINKNKSMTGIIAMSIWHYSIKLFGTSEFDLRLWPCLTGIFSLIFMFFLARKFLSDNYALLASGIAAISPFQVYYSVDLREYSFIFLISIISSILFINFINKKSFLNGIYCSLLCSFGFCLQYGFVFLVAAFNIVILYFYRTKDKRVLIINWFIPQLIFLIIVLLSYYFIIRFQMEMVTQKYLLEDMWQGGLKNLMIFTAKGTDSILFSLFNNKWIALVIIGLAVINRPQEYKKDEFHIMLLLGFVPFFLVWFAALLQKYPYGGVRQNIAFMPFLYILLCFGLYGFRKYDKKIATNCFLIFLIVCSGVIGLQKKFSTPFSNMPAIVEYLKREFKQGDIIMANPYSNWTYQYYRRQTFLPDNIFLTESLLYNDIKTVYENIDKYLNRFLLNKEYNSWFIFAAVEGSFEKDLFDYINQKRDVEQVFSSSGFKLFKISKKM